MAELNAEKNREKLKDMYTKNIRAGVYSFVAIPEWKMKDEIRDELLAEVVAGTASDIVIDALVDYQVGMVRRKRITIDDVHEAIRDRVKEVIDNG